MKVGINYCLAGGLNFRVWIPRKPEPASGFHLAAAAAGGDLAQGPATASGGVLDTLLAILVLGDNTRETLKG